MASTYLSRTPGSAGNRKTNTTSLWLKRSTLGTSYFNAWYEYGAGKDHINISFQDDALTVENYTGTSLDWKLSSNQVFRDVSAWYHIVIAIDTTQSTSTDRVKMYVNGNQITSFSTSSYPALNSDTAISQAQTTRLGVSVGGAYYDGSMSHVHFIDGTAYDASTFGETDATTGIWKPKTAPSVTYGTTGFFIKFENSGSMGLDSSGNANNFTVNGNLTQTVDTPTNVFATLNALKFTNTNLTNGSTTFTSNGGSWTSKNSTLGVSAGKWYAEFKMSNATSDESGIGIASDLTPEGNFIGSDATRSPGIGYNSDGKKHVNGTNTVGYFSSLATNDIVGVALDIDGGTVQFYKNGSVSGSVINLSDAFGTSDYPLFFVCCVINSTSIQANFGNGYFGTTPVASAGSNGNGAIFEYDVPTGYYALNTKNINTYG